MIGTKTKTCVFPLQLELPQTPKAASLSRLKDLLGSRTKIGFALGTSPAQLTAAERVIALEQFNAVSPENCMKPGPIQPREDHFQFEEPDELIAFALANDLEVTGHCLAWHQQFPLWFFKDQDEVASRKLVLARLKQHIQTVMGRYRGKVKGWDVVNEAIADQGDEMLRQTPWTQTVGDDFVEHAFRLANQADPDAELYYNDFNIERPEKRAKTLQLLKQLLQAGVRIDGVGIQGHWVLNQVPFDNIEKAIIEYHSLGLKVMITELDLDIMDRPDCGADVSWQAQAKIEFNPYQHGFPDDVIAAHAEQYGRLFEIFATHREKLSRITFWGLHDGTSWLNGWPWKRNNSPLLFDRACNPKVAFHEVVSRVTSMTAADESA